GINSLVRKEAFFTTKPVHAKWQGIRAGLAPSWERVENGKTVLLALRTHQFDGKPMQNHYKDFLQADIMLVISSLDGEHITESQHIGIVPFGDGSFTLRHNATTATITEHFLSGHKVKTQIPIMDQLTIMVQQFHDGDALEWVEIVLTKVPKN
ncbi:MAG: hypothetical protein RIR73_21, partial [Chloroflexota bacterium]